MKNTTKINRQQLTQGERQKTSLLTVSFSPSLVVVRGFVFFTFRLFFLPEVLRAVLRDVLRPALRALTAVNKNINGK